MLVIIIIKNNQIVLSDANGREKQMAMTPQGLAIHSQLELEINKLEFSIFNFII